MEINLDIFEKMRQIITKSENDLQESVALVDKFKPQDVDPATHRKLVGQILHSEILLGNY